MSGLPSSKNYGSCRRSSNDEPSVSSQASSPKAARKLSGRQIVRNFLDEVFGDGSPVDYVMQTVNPVAVEDLQLVESEEELQIWLPDLHRCQIRKLWKALEVLPSERTYLLAQNASEPQDVLSQVNFMPFVGKASSPRFADASPEGPKLRRLSSSCQSWPAHAPGGAVMVENRRFFEDTGLLWIDVCGEPLESRPVSWEEDYKNYLEHLAESYGIHPASIEDCLTPGELPKTEFTNGVTFCLMRYCVEHPISGSTQDELSDVSSKIVVIVTHHPTDQDVDVVITLHLHPLRANPEACTFEHYYKLQNPGAEAVTKDALVNYLLDDVLETYSIALDRLHLAVCMGTHADPRMHLCCALIRWAGGRPLLKVDKYERELTEWTSVDATTLLYSVRRRVSVYKRLLQTTEGSVHKYVRHVCLQGGHDPFAQDLHDTVKNLLFHTEDLYECTAELLNLHISIASHRSGHLLYLLTILTVFFLPITFISSLYGMNFETMPELKWPHGYAYVISLMLLSMALTALCLWYGGFICRPKGSSAAATEL